MYMIRPVSYVHLAHTLGLVEMAVLVVHKEQQVVQVQHQGMLAVSVQLCNCIEQEGASLIFIGVK